MNEIRAWEKRPNESSKAFKAFHTYVTMIDHSNPVQQTRSIEKAAVILGYKMTSISLLHKWSSENDWIARAEAYDAYMASQIITYKEVGLADYQAAVIGSLVQQLTAMDDIINKSLFHLRTIALTTPNAIDPKEINQLINAIEKKDSLARRAGKMPTTYMRENAYEDEDAPTTYVIGGGNE